MLDYEKKALAWHGEQRHGCLSIKEHLREVTDKFKANYEANKFYYWTDYHYDIGLGAAWLHDVIEDTIIDNEILHEYFGTTITEIVMALTDAKGKTRTERHIHTYYKIRENDMAVYIKMCDRWHNHKRTLENKELKYAKDYFSEYPMFKFALYSYSYFLPFWKELDVQYIELGKLLPKEKLITGIIF